MKKNAPPFYPQQLKGEKTEIVRLALANADDPEKKDELTVHKNVTISKLYNLVAEAGYKGGFDLKWAEILDRGDERTLKQLGFNDTEVLTVLRDINYIIDNFKTIPLDSLRRIFTRNPSITSTPEGSILVHLAVQSERTDILQFLLQNNTDLNKPCQYNGVIGVTPLMIAAKSGDSSIISLLLDNHANYQLHDNEFNNCLHFAMESESPSTNFEVILLHSNIPFENIAPLLNEQNNNGQFPIDLVEEPAQIWETLTRYFEECKFKNNCRWGAKCRYLHFSGSRHDAPVTFKRFPQKKRVVATSYVQSPADTKYVSPEEKEAIRRKIYDRTGGRCYLCKTFQAADSKLIYENYAKEGFPGAWNKEHVLPKSRFPEHDNISNWLPAHIDCNSKKAYHDLRTYAGDDFDILTMVLNNQSLDPNVIKALKDAKDAQIKKSVLKLDAQNKAKEFWKSHEINIIKHSDITIERPALGKGAFGIVYRGMWCFEQVAVKELRGGKDEEVLFQQEVMGLHKNFSKHIVRLVGICVPPDPYALVLEYMEGGSLSDFIKSGKYEKRTIADRLDFVLDIAIGMYHIHRQGIVHRDLNPRNVLLTKDKKSCKIADFGLAKEMSATFSSEGKGSLAYMAPEALTSHAHFSPKTDVYAFGICMHELWTGDTPYDGDVLVKVSEILRTPNPLRPQFSPTCDSEFSKLAAECWRASPDERPSFEQLIPRLMEIRKRVVKIVYGK